jgi:hypothetical protein
MPLGRHPSLTSAARGPILTRIMRSAGRRRDVVSLVVPLLAALLVPLFASPALAQEPAPPAASPASAAPPAAPPSPAAAVERRFDELELTLRFPAELRLVEQPSSTEPQVRAWWMGQLGPSELRVRLLLMGRADFGLHEPSQVLELIGFGLTDWGEGGDASFHFDEVVHIEGRFGAVGYGTLARSTETGADGPSQMFRFSGLLESSGYTIEVRARPALAEAEAKTVCDALTRSVVYEGPQRDHKWTEAEALERWQQDAPASLREEEPELLRSAHYIVLTNSSGGKSFSKKMEECYAAIRKVYPFDEVPGRRLMPVFLFRTNDQYYEFFAQAFRSTVEEGRRTGGIASRDFYATWYEAPGDPVHIHEATHQIFANRLGLSGGGSWFQEGVAEYMSTKDNERGAAARAVKKGRAPTLAEFMGIESLLFSSKKEDKSGADEAGSQYELAALFTEFMRESKFGKAKFPAYIRAVGAVQRSNVKAIEAAVRRVYGVDLAGLQQEFIEYCEKR